jgi:glycosyltransferase involved in cell wall biosynthesis
MPKTDAIYISRDDPHDLHSWSGTTYFMGRSLEAAGFRLNYIGPLKTRFKLVYRVKGWLMRRCGWDYANVEPPVLRSYAREASRCLQAATGDIILSCGQPHLVYLETQRPIIFFDDASVLAMSETHPGHTHYHPAIKRRACANERRVLEKCRYACYMSEWAAEGALRQHGPQFESKIKVIPIGANIERVPTAAEVEQAIQARVEDHCELLFVGVDWVNKGGEIALAAAENLHQRGVRVRLHIVGCKPPHAVPDFVQVHGFISKRSAEGAEFLRRLFSQCHFFILPTRAEAYGISFVEANAYGMPALGTEVGGVPTIVRNGENGRLFPLKAAGTAYADCIQDWLQNREKYMELCRSSRGAYVRRLSWTRFGETVRSLVTDVVEEVSCSNPYADIET